jgi:hypothetical protein
MHGRHIRPPGVRFTWTIGAMSSQRSASDGTASQAFVLDPTSIDKIADRLNDAVVARIIDVIRIEGLTARAGGGQRWLDAQEVADRLSVSREWVYEQGDELGAKRIGRGPRPRLRFPAQSVDGPATRWDRGRESNEPRRFDHRAEGHPWKARALGWIPRTASQAAEMVSTIPSGCILSSLMRSRAGCSSSPGARFGRPVFVGRAVEGRRGGQAPSGEPEMGLQPPAPLGRDQARRWAQADAAVRSRRD